MSEKAALAQPKFIKVKDIETARSGYNVYVKVVSAESRLIETRDGKKIPMVDAVVADETAAAKAFFKGEAAALIEKDNVLAIRNGVKRFVKDHISLEIDLFGRVTLEKAVSIPSTSSHNISDAEHRLEDRPRRNRQNDNRRDRPRREGNDRREDRPRREDRDRPRREDREGREDRPRREDREGREDRPRREDKPREDRPRNDRPREDRPREDRRENRDYDRRDNRDYDRRDNRDYGRNNDRNVDRRDNRDDYRRGNRDNRDNRENRGYERRDNRDYDRTDRGNNYRENRAPRQYEEKREENRERRAPLQWTKIADISPGDDRLNLLVKVISVQKVGPKLRCVLGDETGITNAFLPEFDSIYENESIVIFNGRSEVVKEHIELQLDRRGRIEKANRPVAKVNEEFNLSLKAWVPIE